MADVASDNVLLVIGRIVLPKADIEAGLMQQSTSFDCSPRGKVDDVVRRVNFSEQTPVEG